MGAVYAELMAFGHNISPYAFDEFRVTKGNSRSLRFKDNLEVIQYYLEQFGQGTELANICQTIQQMLRKEEISKFSLGCWWK